MAVPSLGETNIATPQEMLIVVDDFLTFHPDVKLIFGTSDDDGFMGPLREFCRGRVDLFEHHHVRSANGRPLYFYNKPLLVRQLADESMRRDAVRSAVLAAK